MKWEDQQSYLTALQRLKSTLCREQDAVQLGEPVTLEFADAIHEATHQRHLYREVQG